MFIKQIIIQGFKSYKEQTVIEPFSPKHNVIVGRNGSGKSNFFAAIRFALSDAYTQMGREERQALLHEGTGSAVMSAYVEIIFDNSDDRMQTGKDETILRRTIGLKKDEYSLDHKNATKADVIKLFETAGLSRSNPYYIVPQGRVTALTNMKDAERLNLLKEVAGSQVYEARRTESLKIMTETDNKRAKIDELLEYIKERLAELEEEKEELRDYQDKDKERRCLEYTIYHREQVELADALDREDEQQQTGIDNTDGSREQFIDGERNIEEVEAEIKQLRQRLELLEVDKREFEYERKEKAKLRAKVELEVKGLSDGQSAAQQTKARYEEELQSVESLIEKREGELEQLMPEYSAKREQESAVKAQLDDAEAIRRRLYAKQGRNSQFGSKRERDDWLRKEIDDCYESMARVKAVRMQTTEDIAKLEQESQGLEADVSELQQRFDRRGESRKDMDKQVESAQTERDRLMDQRKELWREEAKLASVISSAQRELDHAERILSHTMDQNTSRGIAAVRRIKRQLNLDGVYGTLGELITVPERYRTAVEVTAGTSLFHYVVDTDETATKVLEVLQRDQLGRVTFMPLNRLKPKAGNIPNRVDAIPMIEKIVYDKQYEKALQQVFGKTIICPNLAIAAQYARSHGVNAITPEGDRSDKKGALTGGFYDPRHSRLEAIRNVSKWREEYEAKRSRGAEIQRNRERLDQEITRAVGELQKAEQKRQQSDNSYGPLRLELRSKVDALQMKKDGLDEKRRAMEKIEANIKALTDQQSAHEAELSTDFKKALSNQEEAQLGKLSSTVPDLRKQYSELSASRSELEGQKAMIEVELQENLRPHLQQLKSQEFENGGGSVKGSLSQSQRELKRINQTIKSVETRLQETDDSIEQVNTQITELEQRNAERRQSQEETAKLIERHQRKMEKSMQAKAALTKLAAECSRNIRDLGVLPEEAFARFEKMNSTEIVKRLHKVKEALKKYSHVNKKAFEQYNNFTKQRDTLERRREELDASQASIKDLITVLDQRKDEATQLTFKDVSKHFAETFEKLVPAGRGRLIIQRKTDRVQADDDDDDADNDDAEVGAERRESVENYTGVGIIVSFNSKHDEQQRIQQLSGGQKSLCALALVFAIQQCDPAPFYLFDEVDANLDAQYRTAVANMLQSIASNKDRPGQFICTTFRPEMLLVADKCYGVTYRHKTSSIDVVSRAEALEFVEGQRP